MIRVKKHPKGETQGKFDIVFSVFFFVFSLLENFQNALDQVTVTTRLFRAYKAGMINGETYTSKY